RGLSSSGRYQTPAAKVKNVQSSRRGHGDVKPTQLLTDDASISATPSQPLPPPCSKSQNFAASFSSSNTYSIEQQENIR
ncbi:hypothetical protein, partial [Bacillus cereus]|uniref:hypothetical protein n=1 Tax=Bacillus cereus TaxID=1396 RepID=UPI00345BAB96